MTTAKEIESFLAQPAIAIVGMSRQAHHFGNSACRALRDKGFRVYPIHPSASVIDGIACFRTFAELPEPVGGVLIVVPPKEAVNVIGDAAAAGIRRVWLQQGAESPEAIELCKRLGVELVSGECILMFAQPSGIHRAHRFVRQVFHTLPA